LKGPRRAASCVAVLGQAIPRSEFARARAVRPLPAWAPVRRFVEKAVYRSLSVQSASQRFVEKADNRSPCNRAKINFHDCWACGRHPSLPLVASDPRVWPGRCSVASTLSARITPRNLATSAEIAALVSASLRFLDNVLLVGALHLRTLRTRAVQRWIQ